LDRAREERHENYHGDVGMLSETPPRNMDLVANAEKVEVLVPEDEDQGELRSSFGYNTSYNGCSPSKLYRWLDCSARRR
jgi:hypothetical protein